MKRATFDPGVTTNSKHFKSTAIDLSTPRRTNIENHQINDQSQFLTYTNSNDSSAPTLDCEASKETRSEKNNLFSESTTSAYSQTNLESETKHDTSSSVANTYFPFDPGDIITAGDTNDITPDCILNVDKEFHLADFASEDFSLASEDDEQFRLYR